ncbi:hypothetical protein [Phyllobacterium myrsinacearum]|uniref:Uncharacterized protein n=1 Tax=Phyllobacterium myrsinacearum TaxID=28101 RepID=A0A839EW61_9HYPH|nr:hypothetical protein [Phyllobacterium myrsinacearum]MBA8881754.1 hypothetical protein [Phyllobacterium myrsinacearum]
MSPLEDDILVWHIVGKPLLEHELELFASKWFDYRELTPLAATRRYIDVYGEIYKRHFAENLDSRAAQYVKPLTVEKVFDGLAQGLRKYKRWFIGFWRGRQVADALGMPYHLYIDLALKFRMRYWNQRHLPQPEHLFGELDVEKIQKRWEEMQSTRLYLSDEPAYIMQNYRGIGHQDDYHEWLMKQAGLRSNPPEFLARFVNDDLLPLEKIENRYDDFMVERVNRYLQ